MFKNLDWHSGKEVVFSVCDLTLSCMRGDLG